MLYLQSIIFFCLLLYSNCLNILVYAPAFAASHSKFLGKLADTLTERGHNVTYLMPVVNIAKRDECKGVKITKDVVIVEAGEKMLSQKQADTPNDEILDVWWTVQMDSSNSREIFQFFCSDMKIACENFLSRRDIFEDMKARNFDLAILEPVSACGLGFVKALGIEKTILASSSVFYDVILPYIGEPLDYSYVPSGYSVTGQELSLGEKFENWMVSREISIALEGLFDGEMEIYRRLLGHNLTNWRHLFPSASIFFVNSNPFFDFPRPVLEKTVPIGGISVNMGVRKEDMLTEEWEKVLNQRPHTMLVSFGTLVMSTHMPKKWRSGLLEAFKSFPNVTFIWKYESDDHSFANGIDNIYFSKWVPQNELLNDNRLTAFLSHGGLGSIMELAFSGKPALIIPVFADQTRNANTLARHRGAICLHKSQMKNTEVLKKAFKSVLFDASFKNNSLKLAATLRNQPNKPKDTLIKYTEFVGEFGPFPQMDPYGRHLNVFQKSFIDIYTLIIVVSSIFVALIFNVIAKLIQYFIKSKSSEKND